MGKRFHGIGSVQKFATSLRSTTKKAGKPNLPCDHSRHGFPCSFRPRYLHAPVIDPALRIARIATVQNPVEILNMNAHVKCISLAAACCLILGAAGAADLDPAGDIKAQAEKFVKVDNPEYLPAIKRVVITSYMVDFVSELKYTKSLSGLEAMIGADSDVSIKLVGSNNEQYQSITDKFYQQTVEQLKAQGIEVVGNDELKALPEFAELVTYGVTPVPSEQDAKSGKGLFFTTQGLPLQLSDETLFIPTFTPPFVKPKKDDFLTFGTRFGGNFSVGQAQYVEEKIAKKLGASALKVRLTVLGGQLTPDTSFWSGGKVSTRAAASFVDFVTRYAFITPDGNKARVALSEIAETGDIGELVNTTSDGTKTADAAKNVALVALNVVSIAARLGGVGGTGGIGGFSSTTEYECRVQPESFEKALLDNQLVVVRMFGEKMKAPGK
jgi:hypothetical protein